MGSLGGIISSISSLATKLLSETSPSSSNEGHDVIEKELNKLTNTLSRIKATLYDAEEREIRDRSVKLWLKELNQVAYAAEDVLDEYHYAVLQAQVEAKGDSAESSRKRKKLELPGDLTDRINETMRKFHEIANCRIALQLREDDGARRWSDEVRTTPTSHMVVESTIIGREMEKERLIDFVCSDCNNGDVVSVVTIVGLGGLGKTAIAQLVYNDARISEKFDLLGWICVSTDFGVERLTKEVLESIGAGSDDTMNLSVLQVKLKEIIKGKLVFLVLDDVWNEKGSDWELFQIPFLSAKLVKILVTSRNEPVARIMQTVPSFYLDYLSDEQCWQLFKQYAFDGINYHENWKLETGKLIMKKCGRLPLAVKSIASLLRQEKNEENWRDILENDLWELDSTKEIFPPLQISYSRLPPYLKPCLLFCSIFPKDYVYNVEELTQLWFAQGYIESKRKKNIEEIGQEYTRQLLERSFFDYTYYHGTDQFRSFKLHDMVHDLALLNSENKCWSIEYGKPAIFPDQINHIYVESSSELVIPFLSGCFGSLRTIIMTHNIKNFAASSNLSEIQSLRAVVFKLHWCHEFEFLNSIGNLKHLRYISLEGFTFRKLPESICFLYNLQTLSLSYCDQLVELPNFIGKLVSLQFLHLLRCSFRKLPESFCYLKSLKALRISGCELVELPEHIGNLTGLEELSLDRSSITMLPESFCHLKSLRKLKLISCWRLKELPGEIGHLTNLQTLVLQDIGFTSLPPSFNKLTGIRTLNMVLVLHVTMSNNYDEIGWLNDIVDLKGVLCFTELRNTDIAYVQQANLINKHNLECLKLYWNEIAPEHEYPSVITLKINNTDNDNFHKYGDETDLYLLKSFQPHPNLRKLEIGNYCSISFPKWVGDPLSCASLENILLVGCKDLVYLPFDNLCNLKHLKISGCDGLQLLKAECLPFQLQELIIHQCEGLISVPGIQKLNSLIKLAIYDCDKLKWLLMEPDPSPEMTMHAKNSFFHISSMGLGNLTALTSLEISTCPKLEVMPDELPPVESCEVRICQCPKLREWCLQHNLIYEDVEIL
ncbi:hypothetical protein LUZ60_001791 [Juncus effusus]|nr:hypothetical protein LUZ60_001791 [Juncus effusus]